MIRRPKEPGPRAAFERLCTAPERADADALVFADWLTEQGSTMGEYITLSRAGQNKPADKLRERDRLKWLGRIGAFLEPHKDEFVGGLPELAVLAFGVKPEQVMPHARATEWLMFRGLRIDARTSGVPDAWVPLVTSPALRKLKRIDGLTRSLLTALVEKKSKVRSLEVTIGDALPLKELEALSELRELRFRGARAIDDLLTLKRLTKLEIANSISQLDWSFVDGEHAIDDLTLYEWISSSDWERDQRREKGLKLRFRGAPRFKTLELTLGGKFVRALPQQLLQLGNVPLQGLHVIAIPARPFDDDERELVRRSLGPRAASLEVR